MSEADLLAPPFLLLPADADGFAALLPLLAAGFSTLLLPADLALADLSPLLLLPDLSAAVSLLTVLADALDDFPDLFVFS